MRGRQSPFLLVQHRAGNTPAYAGKTGIYRGYIRITGKHPRVCGEDCHTPLTALSAEETPPRMRGRPLELAYGVFSQGNTPAYAGKTCHQRPTCGRLRKHPRVCGEDPVAVCLYPTPPETPPRMRGRLAGPFGADLPTRNTPAYAGKTAGGTAGGRHTRKHPRVCGEDFLFSAITTTTRETPPRMRGRLGA